jgi:hypothetical protein
MDQELAMQGSNARAAMDVMQEKEEIYKMGNGPMPIEAAALTSGNGSTLYKEFDVYDSRLTTLQELLSNLESRLASILNPQEDSNAKAVDPGTPAKSELAARLNDMNNRLDYAMARLHNITNRVDL